MTDEERAEAVLENIRPETNSAAIFRFSNRS